MAAPSLLTRVGSSCAGFLAGSEALLAVIYGKQLLGWFDSDVFHDIVAVAIVLAVALTLLSMLRFLRATRSPHRRRASA